MTTGARREALLTRLREAQGPLSGTKLARELGVSRQIIVGDISILRAAGEQVYATPRGYVLPKGEIGCSELVTLICNHSVADMERELNIIVDNGGEVLDVLVMHPVYGTIRADLLITSRRDVRTFLSKMAKCKANPLLIVTGGIHMHTVRVPDDDVLAAIRQELSVAGILSEPANVD